MWSASNWDTPEQNFNSRAKFYLAQNLPYQFAILFDLHFAVSSVAFFMGTYSPVQAEPHKQSTITNIMWQSCMQRFKQAVQQNEQAYISLLSHTPDALDALKKLYHHVDPAVNSKQTLEAFAIILSVFSDKVANDYRVYIKDLFDTSL